jgi:hypothetical protein
MALKIIGAPAEIEDYVQAVINYAHDRVAENHSYSDPSIWEDISTWWSRPEIAEELIIAEVTSEQEAISVFGMILIDSQ